MVKNSENFRFKPKPNQIKFVEMYLDLDSRKTKLEIAAEIGITDRTIRNWFNNEYFINWLNEKKQQIVNKSLTDIYVTAVRKAKAGDFNFTKLLLEMHGDYTPTIKQDVSIKVTEIIISHVVEVISRYVSDENIRKQISAELCQINLN